MYTAQIKYILVKGTGMEYKGNYPAPCASCTSETVQHREDDDANDACAKLILKSCGTLSAPTSKLLAK